MKDLFYIELFPACCAIKVLQDFQLDYYFYLDIEDGGYQSLPITVEDYIKEIQGAIRTGSWKRPLYLATTPDTEAWAEVEIALSYCGFDILATVPSTEKKANYSINLWAYFR